MVNLLQENECRGNALHYLCAPVSGVIHMLLKPICTSNCDRTATNAAQ